MSLVTYKDARPYAKAIRDEIVARTMPPWKADPAIGHFANDARLSHEETRTLVQWVAAGAPQGDPSSAPRPPASPSGWRIGKPDVELALPLAVDVPRDGVLDNQYFSVPTGFTTDRWIEKMEIRPGNRRVLHHATVFIVPAAGTSDGSESPGVKCTDAQWAEAVLEREKHKVSRGGVLDREYLFSWTPGSGPFSAGAGAARRIPAGATLVFEMHYAPDGKAPTTDRTAIGFVFAKAPVTEQIDTVTITNRNLEIPPGDANFEAKACYLFARARRLLSLKPHMHLRGKDFSFTLVSRSGARTPLLSVPTWDFDWQLTYVLGEPVELVPGDRIEVVAHYDNSAQNRRNPDATLTATWDESTTGEMLAGMLVLASPRK